jgi:hypothetical protein
MLKKLLVTIGGSLLALLVLVSVISSKQGHREREKQAAILEFDRKNAKEASLQQAKAASAAAAAYATQAHWDLETEEDIANLRSPDRAVVSAAIQRIRFHKACKAVPDLMDLLKESRDDYIAGISAQTIAVCGERSIYDTIYDTIADQFLRRDATPSMIDAIGNIDTSDERVAGKLDRLISEPNQDEDVPRVARRVRNQFQLASKGH